jgi:hypothetical protein
LKMDCDCHIRVEKSWWEGLEKDVVYI